MTMASAALFLQTMSLWMYAVVVFPVVYLFSKIINAKLSAPRRLNADEISLLYN